MRGENIRALLWRRKNCLLTSPLIGPLRTTGRLKEPESTNLPALRATSASALSLFPNCALLYTRAAANFVHQTPRSPNCLTFAGRLEA